MRGSLCQILHPETRAQVADAQGANRAMGDANADVAAAFATDTAERTGRSERAIEAAGAHPLFLPPYSPEPNPIETVFAEIDTPFRKTHTRTVEEAWRQVGTLLDLFSPEECAVSLGHADNCYKKG